MDILQKAITKLTLERDELITAAEKLKEHNREVEMKHENLQQAVNSSAVSNLFAVKGSRLRAQQNGAPVIPTTSIASKSSRALSPTPVHTSLTKPVSLFNHDAASTPATTLDPKSNLAMPTPQSSRPRFFDADTTPFSKAAARTE